MTQYKLIKESYNENTTYNNWLDTGISYVDMQSKYDFLYITIFEEFSGTKHGLTNTLIYMINSRASKSQVAYSGDRNGAFTIGIGYDNIRIRVDFNSEKIDGYKIIGVKIPI